MLLKNIEIFFAENFTQTPKAIAVAVSGGSDSLALTFLLHEFCLKNKIKLYAATIDHKMRKTSSIEALQLNKILTKHKITHEILTLDKKNIPQKNIEANLREARYSMLHEFCLKQKINIIFLGHHQGDVAENFLIRLFRGSQIDGLSAIQETSQLNNLKLCRPLLNAKKDELKTYLKNKKITWFEDETNDDEKFLRNKIRKFLTQFDEREIIENRIKNAAQNIAEMRELTDELLLSEAANCLIIQNDGSFIIDLENYQKISPKIALKILSLVLIEVSGKIYKPRITSLKNFEKNILNLQKGQKTDLHKCFASLLNQEEKRDFKLTPQKKYLKIYRQKNNNITHKKFDDEHILINNIFLAKLDKDGNPVKPYKFYFRTILGKIN